MELAQQRTIPAPSNSARHTLAFAAVAAALIAIVVIGLFVRSLAIAPASIGTLGSPEWRAFRAGEISTAVGAAAASTGGLGSPEWRAFRAGERDTTPAAVADPWLTQQVVDFRTSERNER